MGNPLVEGQPPTELRPVASASGILNMSVLQLLSMPLGEALLLLAQASAQQQPAPAEPAVAGAPAPDIARAEQRAREALRRVRLGRAKG